MKEKMYADLSIHRHSGFYFNHRQLIPRIKPYDDILTYILPHKVKQVQNTVTLEKKMRPTISFDGIEIIGGIESSFEYSNGMIYCVIPHDAPMFFTEDEGIVSEKLIVFNKKENFDEYYKLHNVASGRMYKHLWTMHLATHHCKNIRES